MSVGDTSAGEALATIDAGEKLASLEGAVSSVIRGKSEAVRLALVCLLARGHLLIEDVPGVGKTTLGHALARAIDCRFQRIQFTSDMLPSDVLGVTVYSATREEFDFKPGPIFANILLADEINRTTPKTQSALLEAMNEGQISIERHSYPLPAPFMVIATQNPIEYHGTFPLPEAQLDRFLLRIEMGYPDAESERDILRLNGKRPTVEGLRPVLHGDDVVELQRLAGKVRVDDAVVDYIMAIVKATREHSELALGVSPRGSIALYRAAQALALLEGLDFVTPHHVKTLAIPVFGHRALPDRRFGTEATSGERARRIIEEILQTVAVPV
ncbi:MAG: AAA domain-containing protein [Acidobacteria bacterium]|nr:AAA domain-containing protein [Acidobacteriota bacterium]